MELIIGILIILILGAFTWATSVIKEELKREDTEENNDQKQ